MRPRPTIRVLPEELASQIAAGEVVERPASVVKELVENAIDAGARRVDVSVARGGKAEVVVADDGCGMTDEDLRLALRRHATSKLRSVEDLVRIRTLGFRGEALPSIASVSRLRIVSRPEEAVAGTVCLCEPGRAPVLRAEGCPVGTEVRVSDLFFNVPARLKFLKTERTELAHVTETVLQIGLAHPGVHLTLREGDRLVLDLPKHGDLLERAAAALGRRGGGGLHGVQAAEDGYRLEAALGSPLAAVAGARNVYLLVNGRAVRDRLLLRMLSAAYGGLLAAGRYPVAVVHLRLPETAVDVNVHPQKQEVRFAEERRVASFVRRALAQGVTEAPWATAAGVSVLGDAAPARTYRVARARGADAAASRPPGTAAGGGASPRAAAPPAGAGRAASAAPASDGAATRLGAGHLAERRAHYAGVPVGARDTGVAPPAGASPSGDGPLLPGLPKRSGLRGMRYIGQLGRTYLLLEDAGGLLLVDQHAAHERITYARLRDARKAGTLAVQRLLFPATVSLSPVEAAVLQGEDGGTSGAAHLGRLGFDVSLMGDRTAAIRGVPSLLADADPEALLRDALDALQGGGEPDAVEGALDAVIARLACHGSVRAGRALGEAEVAGLLEALDRVEQSGYCPHGRPVVIRISEAEIRRRFGRE